MIGSQSSFSHIKTNPTKKDWKVIEVIFKRPNNTVQSANKCIQKVKYKCSTDFNLLWQLHLQILFFPLQSCYLGLKVGDHLEMLKMMASHSHLILGNWWIPNLLVIILHSFQFLILHRHSCPHHVCLRYHGWMDGWALWFIALSLTCAIIFNSKKRGLIDFGDPF